MKRGRVPRPVASLRWVEQKRRAFLLSRGSGWAAAGRQTKVFLSGSFPLNNPLPAAVQSVNMLEKLLSEDLSRTAVPAGGESWWEGRQ